MANPESSNAVMLPCTSPKQHLYEIHSEIEDDEFSQSDLVGIVMEKTGCEVKLRKVHTYKSSVEIQFLAFFFVTECTVDTRYIRKSKF